MAGMAAGKLVKNMFHEAAWNFECFREGCCDGKGGEGRGGSWRLGIGVCK